MAAFVQEHFKKFPFFFFNIQQKASSEFRDEFFLGKNENEDEDRNESFFEHLNFPDILELKNIENPIHRISIQKKIFFKK